MIFLISGGARSGKSSFAEKIARYRGGEQVIYVATAEAGDEEMKSRIERHLADRPDSWQTIEEPRKVSRTLQKFPPGSAVLLDCITVLIANLLLKKGEQQEKPEQREKEILNEMEAIVNISREIELDLIMVTNEVGQGVIPGSKLGRIFRDLSGRINQFLARQADRVYITFAGLPVEIKEQGLRNIERYED